MRTHLGHCSDVIVQQPDCHKARLLQQPSGRLHHRLLISCNEYLTVLREYLVATVAIMWLHYSTIICTGWGQGNASRKHKLYLLVYKAIHSLAPCYLNELCIPVSTVPKLSALCLLLLVIWSYPEQGYNSATGHLVLLVRSLKTVSHWAFVWHLDYQFSKTCSIHIFSHVPTSPTNCFQSMNGEHCTAPLFWI